ncbi:MAG: hypothetical protein JW969_19630 [Spirochaetales bacterium]|nr:hypothetical protein [Spirochaetales bacterium]
MPEKEVSEEWYVLENGRLTPHAREKWNRDVSYLPWTVQERITDIAFLNGRLFFGINGYGIAYLDLNKGTSDGFQYLFDDSLFHYRTFTGFYNMEKGLVAHVYFNSILNIIDPGAFSTGEFNLLRITEKNTEFEISQMKLPFQTRNTGWELISLLPVDYECNFCMEWKYSDSLKTDFNYTCFDFASHTEKNTNKSEFMKAFHFRNSEELGKKTRLGIFIQTLLNDLRDKYENCAFHFTVKKEDSYLSDRYSFPPANNDPYADILTVNVLRTPEEYYAVLKDGEVYRCLLNGDNVVQIARLPVLPAESEYTVFYKIRDVYFCAFEEIDFFNVGRAGLVRIRDPFEQGESLKITEKNY